jgi:hypothetical protein
MPSADSDSPINRLSPERPNPTPQLPPAIGEGSDLTLSWLMQKKDEGEAFLAADPGWPKIQRSIDAIMSMDDQDGVGALNPTIRSGLSQTKTNRIAKIAEDIAALLTDTKPFWDYSVSNRRFEQQAEIYGKLATFWYQRRNIDLRLADAIKYYVAAGTGYVHLFWNPDLGDLDCIAEDPRNVIPIDPTGYESLESCRGVIVKRKVPTSYIRDKYGIEVKSETDGSNMTLLEKAYDTASQIVGPIWASMKNGNANTNQLPRIPTVWLFTCYLKDNRNNTRKDLGDRFTGKPIEMGNFMLDTNIGSPTFGTRIPADNWSYVVKVGDPLYPNRRMIQWCGTNKLVDQPSIYWHGQFPIIKITPNPYPWSWFGKAPCHDLLPLQRSLNKLLRVVDDHAAQVAQPGAVMDKTNVSRSVYNSFNTRSAGYKIYQNPMAGKGIQIVNPPPLDQGIWKHIEWIQQEMKEISGLVDMSEMMNLGQLPSNSTVESIMRAMTPAIRFRSRIMEAFTRSFAEQLAYNFTEFYTFPLRVTILGPGGITQDDFDFDPGTMLPDYVQVDDFDEGGQIKPQALLRGPLPKYNRAKEFLRRFAFKIQPGSLLSAAQTEQKLVYLMMWRGGIIDTYTLWEIFNVPNIGNLPDNVRTVPERIAWAQQVGLMGQVSPEGRKASAQQGPRVVMKEQ